jgi:hypothetical protein
MKLEEARNLIKSGAMVRRASWKAGKWLMVDGNDVVQVTMDAFGTVVDSRPYSFLWDDINAEDWEAAPAQGERVTSICDHPIWETARPYFGERPHELRGLEVRGVPRPLSLRLQQLKLPCIACGRPVHVFRRRKGSDVTELYYSPACPSADSPGCCRGGECRDEVERIRSFLAGNPIPKPQLGLF